MWTAWTVIAFVMTLCVIGMGVYNIRSLIRKWKAIPANWFDLLLGIVIWCIAIMAIIFIFLKYTT